MRTQSPDTPPDAERVQVDLLRRASVARRFGLARSLSQTAIQLARRAIRRSRSDADEEEVMLTFVAVHYGQDLADRLHASDAEMEMITPDILAAITPVVDAFERIGISYCIGGSIASSAHGIARSTLDVDVVADLAPAHVRPLIEALQGTYYIDEEMVQDAIRQRSSFNVVHLETMLKVDVFVLKTRLYDQEAFRRIRRDTLDEAQDAREFYVASPEDVILNKLEWYRLGGGVSDRQWNDAVGVLKVQRDALDFSYLRRWAADLRVSDLLDRALGDAGIS